MPSGRSFVRRRSREHADTFFCLDILQGRFREDGGAAGIVLMETPPLLDQKEPSLEGSSSTTGKSKATTLLRKTAASTCSPQVPKLQAGLALYLLANTAGDDVAMRSQPWSVLSRNDT
mmetsp:Transcript_6217/g.17185  ORF Transcript_6217/g.17185 Transcript_6217/m.17185 type:complete len:118 (+) Transcript_6217:769-1122(+)